MINATEVGWIEDSSATVYGRLMARDGSGNAIAGEGRYLQQADLSSITYKVFDESDVTSPIATGTVDIAQCIFDTPQTANEDPVWKFSRGFNFRHDLGPNNFPIGGHIYQVEYKISTTGGTVAYAIFRGPAQEVHS